MKHIINALAITCLVSLSSCGDSYDPHKEQMVIDAARRDAQKVADAKAASMAQEHAMLAIKVRENKLRDAGHDHEADVYIGEIEYILIDSLHIISPYE